jgi:hypothetical protein
VSDDHAAAVRELECLADVRCPGKLHDNRVSRPVRVIVDHDYAVAHRSSSDHRRFIGSWFVSDPWPGTTNEIIKAAMQLGTIGLCVAALILGATAWRSVEGWIAIATVLSAAGLVTLVLTAEFN